MDVRARHLLAVEERKLQEKHQQWGYQFFNDDDDESLSGRGF
jgi:hypothetical protein